MTNHKKKNISIIIIGILIAISSFAYMILTHTPTEISEQIQLICIMYAIFGCLVSLIGFIAWHDGDECGSGQLW